MAIKEIAIGRLAARTGLAVSAIHFYETRGLVSSHRNGAGHRRFVPSDIRKLSFVKIAQELGFPLARIAEILAGLPGNRAPTRKDWTRISKNFKTDIENRIARLEKLRDNLDGCIGCGCLSLKRCALYNQDDKAAADGPGARFLVLR